MRTNNKYEKHLTAVQGTESDHTFNFDRVFPPDVTQKEVYDDGAKPVIEDVLQGYNGVFGAFLIPSFRSSCPYVSCSSLLTLSSLYILHTHYSRFHAFVDRGLT
jgi:hypothetical protein